MGKDEPAVVLLTTWYIKRHQRDLPAAAVYLPTFPRPRCCLLIVYFHTN